MTIKKPRFLTNRPGYLIWVVVLHMLRPLASQVGVRQVANAGTAVWRRAHYARQVLRRVDAL